MEEKTKILGLDYILGEKWPTFNKRFYHGLLVRWWNKFRLDGRGLVIGESGNRWIKVKAKFLAEHSEIDEIYSVDFQNSDINWDITVPYNNSISFSFDWIVCQAVLEHVTDPPAAIRNLSNTLRAGGLLYVHSHGPEFVKHRKPIDCYRFLLDALISFCDMASLELVDYIWTPLNWFALYKRI